LRLVRDAVEQSPKDFQYHENLARVLIFLDRFDEADHEIIQMKHLNHLGTANVRIKAIEQRLETARTLAAKQQG
jgi:hypothetical protein